MRMQIKEFANFTGVSVRTLHYYDKIGLLKPADVDEHSGYRFYDRQSLLRMQEILFYRELDFPLKSIMKILSSPDYDKEKALQEQKTLLILKKERLERLISAIDGATKGECVMKAFDSSEFQRYKAEAQQRWGNTAPYQEYEEKMQGIPEEELSGPAERINEILAEFAVCMEHGAAPDSAEAQNLVKELQEHITENYYTCTREILFGLGQMYMADERFRNNIDKAAPGTAAFISKAIEIYCK